jgi:hypothetical protein
MALRFLPESSRELPFSGKTWFGPRQQSWRIEEMATRKVMLKYPENLIQEPVLFRMVREYDVMPNIRRARETDTVGEIVLELEGSPDNL